MEYVIRVFKLSDRGATVGKYMDLNEDALGVEGWLEKEAEMGFELDSLTDIIGSAILLRVVVKRAD